MRGNKKRIKREKYSRPVVNSALKDSGIPELVLFNQFAYSNGIEMALTEFAARTCYNSVMKLGSSPTFVEKVLGHGHLSVAEHASIAVARRELLGDSWLAGGYHLINTNRFFELSPVYILGNMRSWIEYLVTMPYKPEYEVFLSVFPVAFKDDPLIQHFDSEFFPVLAPVYVEGEHNTNLLAVNLADTQRMIESYPEGEESIARYTWLISGISRSCSHQIARHRAASISEQSMRYVDVRKSGAGFIYPPTITDAQRAEMQEQNESAFAKYVKLRDEGVKAEDARSVLPLATETKMVLSFGKKGLLHFLEERCAPGAQGEIRQLARKMAWQAWKASNSDKILRVMEKYGIDKWEGQSEAGSE